MTPPAPICGRCRSASTPRTLEVVEFDLRAPFRDPGALAVRRGRRLHRRLWPQMLARRLRHADASCSTRQSLHRAARAACEHLAGATAVNEAVEALFDEMVARNNGAADARDGG